jgi:peptide/nickel transport system substrate-binding protein
VKVRQALALATDRQSYVNSLGGENASGPSLSIVNPATPGYVANPNFGDAAGGDVEGAKKLLEESGETLPYPIKFTYPIGSDAAEKAFASLKATYDEAGFDVTLDGLDPSGPYYDTIQKPGSDTDLSWSGWGADWPSISTVIPPLFDSRINITKTSNGQDYGHYVNDDVNAAMDAASAEPDLDKANQMWADIDNTLAEEVAYIPLDVTKFYFLRGSNIENYVNAISTTGYPDLGVISVKNGGK